MEEKADKQQQPLPAATDSSTRITFEDPQQAEPDVSGEEEEVFQEVNSRSPSLAYTEPSDESSVSFEDGERQQLLQAMDDEADDSAAFVSEIQITIDDKVVTSLKRGDAFYGHALSKARAAEEMPIGEGGLMWHALVIPDDFIVGGKLLNGLPKRDFDMDKQAIKPRRPSLPVTMSDLFKSLTKIKGPNGPRWIFHGVLNGWPGLTCLELVSLQIRRKSGTFVSPKDVMTGQVVWLHHWRKDQEGKEGEGPEEKVDHNRIYRAKLRGAPWTGSGWAKDRKGFIFWYESQNPQGPRLLYGPDIVQTTDGNDKCTMVHMFNHRYAVAREGPKDKITYHSIVLLEWEHGKYCTVVEGAYLNGLGGYKGKSNWYDDKDEPVTQLFQTFPNEMICPWLSRASELRCFDVQARNLDEFKEFVAKHGKNRFVDARFTFSHRARLSYRSKENVAQYLLNYTTRDCGYDEMKRNCQTFAADLCSFLAGKKGVEPFHPVNRIEYRNRTHLFLYDSSMYQSTKQACHAQKTR